MASKGQKAAEEDIHTAVFKGSVKPHVPRQRNRYNAPGPGTYQHSISIGRQASSTKPSSPASGFGTQTRVAYEKTMLSKEHQALMPRNTTQKANYMPKEQVSSFGINPRANQAPKFGFGTAGRGDNSKLTPCMS